MKEIELIEGQISKGNEILAGLSSMRERPTSVINVTAYNNDDVQLYRKKIEAWQYVTREILESIYGERDRHVSDFVHTITSKNRGFDFQAEFRQELNSGLSILEAIHTALEMGIQQNPVNNAKGHKIPKIFISHKTEDKPFVEELVSLIEHVIGSDGDKIFCSSIGGYDIKPGKDILSELKRQFDEYEVLFVVVHSPRYYTSSICLNEMGAAWILGSRFFSFLTADCRFSMLNGVIDGKYMSIKVNDSLDMVVSKLNSFKDYLIGIFDVDKEKFNTTRWEQRRNEFISRSCHIEYESKKNGDPESGDSVPRPMAAIVAERISRSPFVISVSNRGSGVARNLHLRLDEVCDGMLISGLDTFPLEYLKPGRHVSLTVYPCLGDPEKFKMFFDWEEKGAKFTSEDIITI